MERKLKLLSTPFIVDAECVREELQMKQLGLQCDSVLKEKYIKVGVLEFYKFLTIKKYPLLFDSS